MMNDKLSCGIVRDLLPLYIDNLASKESRAAIKGHIKGCDECRKILNRMQDKEAPQEKAGKEIDFLKKVRRRGKMNILSAIIICAVIVFTGVAVFYSLGIKTNSAALFYDTEVDKNKITLHVKAKVQNERIAREKFKESSGKIRADVYTSTKLFLSNKEKSYSYMAKNNITQVNINQDIVWEDGVNISSLASELYKNKNPYIGNNSKNIEIAYILGIHNEFGEYTNELQTSETPYGWIFSLNNEIPKSKEETKIQKMKSYAAVLIAEVDNLDTVTFKYSSGDVENSVEVDSDDASELAGTDIKKAADSAKGVQDLIDDLGI